MHVFQTAGVPPKRGRIILAIIGWIKNSSRALTKSVMEKRSGKEKISPRGPKID
jgi:hypothetical protein